MKKKDKMSDDEDFDDGVDWNPQTLKTIANFDMVDGGKDLVVISIS